MEREVVEDRVVAIDAVVASSKDGGVQGRRSGRPERKRKRVRKRVRRDREKEKDTVYCIL